MTDNQSNINTHGNIGKEHNNNAPTSLKLNIQIRRVPPSDTHLPPTAASEKKKRIDRSDLGDNFVAPDGGWGWFVATASGIIILVSFALAQQFGIIFREHMLQLGISSSQLTSIINIQISVSAVSGLLNGPLFRRFTYRQVSLAGSLLQVLGLFLLVFADSFALFLCSYSCLYGIGRGLTISASSLAVNTYFRQKRRTATAYQFGVAGLGPIVLPYFATYLLQVYGVQGTVLLFAGLALHTIACSLIYQPVLWHVKKAEDAEAYTKPTPEDEIIDVICEPDTPTLPRANDGWFGSRTSLNQMVLRHRLSLREKNQELRRLNSSESPRRETNSFSGARSIVEEHTSFLTNQENISKQDPQSAVPPEKTDKYADRDELEELEEINRDKLPFYKKVAIFFDLDLLRDITYVNLAIGLTLINFVEINFAVLTPFILSDFGFDNSQIALAMSTLGLCDLVIRFLIPLITAKMHLSNKAFYIIGIIGMCIGRALLAYTRDFYVMMAIFIWMGLNKAFRTVFWCLIIPGYVPLKRLPAAAGLQLLMSGIFALVFGPCVGIIRDSTDYAVTLNVLNAICIFAVLMWVLEAAIRKYGPKSKK